MDLYKSAKTDGFQRVFLLMLILAVFTATFYLLAAEAFAAQATLAWDAPTTYADGTPISGLSGYKLYLGTASGSYSQNIDVGNQTTYTVNNLADGATYYFVVMAYDTAGNESGFSNEVSKSFQSSPSTYLITATAGNGGTLTFLGGATVSQATNQTSTISTVQVNQGASQALAITPTSGFGTTAVVVDGVSVGAVAGYTFSNVTANHTIAATFAPTSSSVASGKGDVDGDGRISVADVLIVLRSVVNSQELTPAQKARADVWPLDAAGNPVGDGTITINDAITLLRRAVGLTAW